MDGLAKNTTLTMVLAERTSPDLAAARPIAPASSSLLGGGPEGNEKLTALTGTLLFVGLAVLGVTILRIHQLIWLHLFLGIALIGPVALKMASTGYRVVRYYTANLAYRRKGPPPIALRVFVAPVMVISTVVVFATGVVLLFTGPAGRDALLPIHKVSFIVWVVFTSLHVLAHLPSVAPSVRSELAVIRPAGSPDGRPGRLLALGGAIVAGVLMAVVVLNQFGPWLNFHSHHLH